MPRTKRKNRKKRVTEGIYDINGKLYIALRKDGKLQWISTGLAVSRENVRKAVARRAELKYSSRERTVSPDVTVSEYASIFLERKERETAYTTQSKYYYNVKHIKDYFGDKKVRSITTKQVEAFLDHLLAESRLSVSSANDVRMRLNSMLDMAVEDMVIHYNPAKKNKD